MPSTKGKPTDPKLREEVTEKVKNQPNKDGSGKGQMAAWKAAKISKEYEAEGGDYDNEAGSKNEPKKGAPEHKSDAKKDKEVDTNNTKAADAEEKPKDDEAKTEKEKPAKAEKPAKGAAAGKKAAAEKKEPKKKAEAKPKAPKKTPTEGTRKSSRIQKRPAEEVQPDDDEEEEAAPAKKKKTAAKK